MKIFRILSKIVKTVYLQSATPNTKRMDLFREMKRGYNDNKLMMDRIESENPFESASAKSAMAKASTNAKLMQNRILNSMGAGATPEAVLTAEAGTQAALGEATGTIASGAEANKLNKINSLRSFMQNQLGQQGQLLNDRDSAVGNYLGIAGKATEAGGQIASLFV